MLTVTYTRRHTIVQRPVFFSTCGHSGDNDHSSTAPAWMGARYCTHPVSFLYPMPDRSVCNRSNARRGSPSTNIPLMLMGLLHSRCSELANACRIAADVREWGTGMFGTNKAVNTMYVQQQMQVARSISPNVFGCFLFSDYCDHALLPLHLRAYRAVSSPRKERGIETPIDLLLFFSV